MGDLVIVALGGILGVTARYEVGRLSSRYITASFPYSTMLINFCGSLVIGFFLIWTTERVMADPRWRLLVAIGFCGGFTTFSSYAFETFKLYEQGAPKLALANIAANNLAALAAVFLGAILARRIA